MAATREPTIAETVTELRVLLGQFRRRLKEQADPGDYTLAQSGVIKQLADAESMTGTELARAEGMKPQSMGPVLLSLEERGVVRSAPDPSDGRKTRWSLTADARSLIASTRATKEDWLARVIQSKLTPAEQAELTRGVALLARLLEP